LMNLLPNQALTLILTMIVNQMLMKDSQNITKKKEKKRVDVVTIINLLIYKNVYKTNKYTKNGENKNMYIFHISFQYSLLIYLIFINLLLTLFYSTF